MYRHRLGIVVALLTGLVGVVGMLGLLGNVAGGVAPAEAGTEAVLTVCRAGPPTCDYAVIQDAVDAAAGGDVIKVANGVYTGVHPRPSPPGYEGPAVITQVVYISKSLTLQGGYTVTNWTEPDPDLYPTVLDALGEGRVVMIAGSISVTVEGLHITGGDAAGLGDYPDPGDGGGIAVQDAAVRIRDNRISNNRAYAGAGVNLSAAQGRVMGNTFVANAASGPGGGLSVYQSDALVEGNTLYTNTAEWNGGGMSAYENEVRVVRNVLVDNHTDLWGGGLIAYRCLSLTIEGNQVISNTALQGGGVLITVYTATVRGNLVAGNDAEIGDGGMLLAADVITAERNTIIANRSGGMAGGLSLAAASARVRNNVIADNEALGVGGGLVTRVLHEDAPPVIELAHNTIARNRAADGSGVLVLDLEPEPGQTIGLVNTILVSQTVGISVSAGSMAALEGTLWGSGAWANETDWAGDGTILTGTINLWAVPAFVDPDAGDYHIRPGSPGADAGIDAGVTVDIDGEPRPVGTGYDIGADEVQAALLASQSAFPDPVLAGRPLTYTLAVTNNGLIPLTVAITDTLPPPVTPTGVLTWSVGPLLPGDVWGAQVLVTVAADYSGILTNVLRASSAEGASAAYTLTTPAYLPVEADFAAAPRSGIAPLTVTFTNTSTGDYDTSFWQFGDGITSTLPSPTHTYTAVGHYTVTLTVSGPGGTDTEVRERIIIAQYGLYLPVVLRRTP